jgi:S-DNA-T family DNA segregation ATPase FtsK/SpoIIIE
MHLIIGTQRPSVDVITGLIKANIPSRIAFTVASQIDSRTIIDTQGAEKLIGRGDMLYAPVGAAKPIRVQGAFVSETEIEEIVDFIREQSFGTTYSDDVMAQINRAAELCGQKKGKSIAAPVADGGAEENDPMLDGAIALAVETGKISTSLIQRRLQLGYGRAAKLIDMMERRGIVSAPEGQKPRTVLITREQYLEMKMKSAEQAEVTEEAPL